MGDEQVIQQLLVALDTVNDPRSTQLQRQQANEYCESIKEGNGCYNCGIYLAQANKSDISKYFGLQLLEHMIRTKWYRFSTEQKDQMKKDVLSILARGTKDLLEEKNYIKEKVATLIVEIAKRDWPQQWEDLLNNLVQISLIGDTQAELILMVLRTLPDEIVVFNDTSTTASSSSTLTEQRKKDLMAGINQGLASLFTFFYSIKTSNNTQNTKRILPLVEGVLKTLLSYLEWVPFNVIFDNNLHAALCQLIKEEATRLSACECLLVIMSRKCGQHERHKLIFPFDFLDIFVGSMSVSSGDFETDYNYHKRLGQTLTFLGTNLLKTSPAADKVPASFEKFLQTMLAFANHPSTLLSSYTIPFWFMFQQSDTMCQLPYFNAIQLPIMKMAETKLLKVGDPEKDTSLIGKYSEIDFGNSNEFIKFQATQRSKLTDFIKLIASKQPDVCLEYCAVRLPELMATQTPSSQEMNDPAYLAFESFSTFLSSAMIGIPSEILSNSNSSPIVTTSPSGKSRIVEVVEIEDVTKQKTIAFIESILKCLLEYNTTHLMIIQTQMNCIQALTPYYGKNPASLQFVFGKIVPFITFRQAHEPLTNPSLSLDTLSLRRKSIHSIMHLAGHIPSALLSYLPQLLATAQQLAGQGLLLDTEKVFFIEALVMVSNGMKNFEKQSEFLQSMMGSHEADWNSPEITTAVGSSEAFLYYIGAVLNPTESAQVYEERRKKLQNMVNIFQAIYKRVTVPTDTKEIEEGGYGPHIAHGMSFTSRWPVSQHNTAVLPNIMKLTRTLHHLWDPSVRSLVPPSFLPMYALDDPVIQAILGKERDHKKNMSGDQTLRYLRNVLDACRDGCYSVIGHAAIHGEEFWTMAGISEALLSSVCSFLDFIENRHLRLLLKNFGESFVQNCPEKLRPTLLDPILPPLFTAVFTHINTSYNEINNRSNAGAGDSNSAISEIVDDKILHDLAHVYLDFVQRYVEVKHTYHANEVLIPVIYTVLGCLGWPDSTVLRRGVWTANKLIPILLEDPRYHQLLGRDMIITAVKALAANRNPENALDLLGLIKDIYVQMVVQTNEVAQIPQKALLELPNITIEVVEKLNSQLRSNAHDGKAQRSLFKNLLQERTGINIQNNRQPTILDLPPTNFFAKVEEKSFIDKTTSLDLKNLYEP